MTAPARRRAGRASTNPRAPARLSRHDMPIYEYACQGCGKVFEELIIRRADEAELACPACGKREVSRQMSRPAAAPSSGGGGGGGGGFGRSCGPVG